MTWLRRKLGLKELEMLSEAPHFWENNERAQNVIAEANSLKEWTVPFNSLKVHLENTKELLSEAEVIGDEGLCLNSITELTSIDKELQELEIRKMLSGELDNKSCYLSINSGAGGTEACDWAQMLSRCTKVGC